MVTGDLLFVGSCSGVFYALRHASGDVVWSYDTGRDGDPAEFHGDPAVAGDLVISGCDRATLPHTYAFRFDTGEVAWKKPQSALESDVLQVADLAIGRRWNGDLTALDVETGELRWVVIPTDYTYRYRADLSPVVHGSTVFFGGVDGRAYAVDGLTGRVAWAVSLADAITTAPATDGTHVWVGLAGNALHRIDATNGARTTSCATPERPFGRLALCAGGVVAPLGSSLVALYAPDLSEIRWMRELDDPLSSDQPLVLGDTVVVGTREGEVLGLSAQDGTTAFSFRVDGAVRGLGARGDVLFVGTLPGVLHAWRL